MSGGVVSAIILVVLLAIVTFHVVRGPRGYQVLVEASPTARRALFRRMFRGLLLLAVLPPVVGLTILGRWGAVLAMPVELWPASSLINGGYPAIAPDPFFVWVFSGAILIGILLGAALTLRRRHKGLGPPKSIAHFTAMLPRNRAEVLYGAGISLAAGIGEELFFRLLLPMLLAPLIGSIAGVTVAIILFGVVHSYQGWKGIVTTSVLGVLLTVMYLMSGSLFVAMAFHLTIDAVTLVIRPVIRGAWRLAAD